MPPAIYSVDFDGKNLTPQIDTVSAGPMAVDSAGYELTDHGLILQASNVSSGDISAIAVYVGFQIAAGSHFALHLDFDSPYASLYDAALPPASFFDVGKKGEPWAVAVFATTAGAPSAPPKLAATCQFHVDYARLNMPGVPLNRPPLINFSPYGPYVFPFVPFALDMEINLAASPTGNVSGKSTLVIGSHPPAPGYPAPWKPDQLSDSSNYTKTLPNNSLPLTQVGASLVSLGGKGRAKARLRKFTISQ